MTLWAPRYLVRGGRHLLENGLVPSSIKLCRTSLRILWNFVNSSAQRSPGRVQTDFQYLLIKRQFISNAFAQLSDYSFKRQRHESSSSLADILIIEAALFEASFEALTPSALSSLFLAAHPDLRVAWLAVAAVRLTFAGFGVCLLTHSFRFHNIRAIKPVMSTMPACKHKIIVNVFT